MTTTLRYLSRAESVIAEHMALSDAAWQREMQRRMDEMPAWYCDWAGCKTPAECEDHLHSADYHSADCHCGKTEADCSIANGGDLRPVWA